METTHVTKSRKIRILIFSIVSIIALVLLASCNGKTIVKQEVINAPQVLYVDEFDPNMNNIRAAVDACNIKIHTEYDDGTSEDVPLTFDMLEDVFKAQLNSEGRHYISYMYKGNQLNFDVLIKLKQTYTVRFYDANNNIISEQTVPKGGAAVEPSEAERTVPGYDFIGWDKSFDKVTRDLSVYGIYEKKIVVTFYNGKNVLIDTQYVDMNGDAQSPSETAKFVPGYIFLKWDRELTNIQQDTAIYGIYINDTTTDTDGDGIIDYIEVELLNLDYTKVDTDGNGVNDGDEDSDNDGISNIDEIRSYLKPEDPDTDDDGLTDGEEMDLWTIPDDPDTDADGALDGWEVKNGYDPLTYNDSFQVSATPTETTPGVVIPGLEGNPESLKIEPTTDSSLQNIKGAVIEPHDFSVDGTFDSAVISFKIPDGQQGANLAIMYFNEEKQCLELLDTTVSNGVASAETSHFSTYTLINRDVFEKDLKFYENWMLDPEDPNYGSYSDLEIIFVLDRSGSMSSNDRNYDRLTVSKDLLDKVPQGAKIGLIAFDDSYDIKRFTGNSLTTDKDYVKSLLTQSNFAPDGLTYMYTAVQNAIELFESTDKSTRKIIVLLSDGDAHDTSMHQATIDMANNNNVNIFTVALGYTESSSYYKNYLKPLAEQTGGDASTAATNNYDELLIAFNKIGMGINLFMDSDKDGVFDYYESMDKYAEQYEITDLQQVNVFAKLFAKLWADTEDMDNDGMTNGVKDPDTDGDGYLDGEEVIIRVYYRGNQVAILFQYVSDPTDANSVPKSK